MLVSARRSLQEVIGFDPNHRPAACWPSASDLVGQCCLSRCIRAVDGNRGGSIRCPSGRERSRSARQPIGRNDRRVPALKGVGSTSPQSIRRAGLSPNGSARHRVELRSQTGRCDSVAVSPPRSCLGLDGVPELEHLLPMPIAKFLHIALHAAPKLMDVIVEAFPRRLPAHAVCSTDHLPRRAGSNGFADEAGLPRGEQADQGTRSPERCERIRLRRRRLPGCGHQGRSLARRLGSILPVAGGHASRLP